MLSLCWGALAALAAPLAAAVSLDVDDPASIRAAAKTIATNLMSYEDLTPGSLTTGLLPYPPYYWWESGGVWGGMVDYWAYTKDTTWKQDAVNAFFAQSGPNKDFILANQAYDEGNDDQAFWGLSVASAAEYQLPSSGGLNYAESLATMFNELVERWISVGEEQCGGGLKWQFTPGNAGYDYKSTVTEGSFFQLAARLARYTGNSTYADWAVKVWDWCNDVGLIDKYYHVFDGTNDLTNCTEINYWEWTYTNGLFLYGAANLYAYSKSSVWETRVQGLLDRADFLFFSPHKNSTDIMYEAGCEPFGTCLTDQVSFKAYLARFMAKSTVLVPSISKKVWKLLEASAKAAAATCTGGDDHTSCGQQWYVGGFDGNTGPGQQLSALEVVQALLVKFNQEPALAGGNINFAVPSNYPEKPSSTKKLSSITPTPKTQSVLLPPAHQSTQKGPHAHVSEQSTNPAAPQRTPGLPAVMALGAAIAGAML